MSQGLQELRIAVAAVVGMGVLVGGRFLKCVPIGCTALRPHPHLSLDSTHHDTQTKLYGCHLGFLVDLTH